MRPAVRTVLTSPIHFVAFGFGLGLIPKAPGTWGTLLALPLWWVMHPLGMYGYLAALTALFTVGTFFAGESARKLGEHDVPGIVVDEVVGFLVTTIPVSSAFAMPTTGPWWAWLAAAFVLFRIFDIWKPWPINKLDASVHGGLGIMLDDLVAGVYGAAVLTLARMVL